MKCQEKERKTQSAGTMKVDVSAPDRSYCRYLADTTVDLTTKKQSYTYEFTMKDDDDANGRPEFNMGAFRREDCRSADYASHVIEFQMKNETDTKAVLSISMGAVGGTQITEKHRIVRRSAERRKDMPLSITGCVLNNTI